MLSLHVSFVVACTIEKILTLYLSSCNVKVLSMQERASAESEELSIVIRLQPSLRLQL